MTEEIDELDRLLAERYPPITILELKTGRISTPDRDEAKKQIAYGAAIETVPSDPTRADAWLKELHQRVEDKLRAKFTGRTAAEYDRLCELLDALRDFAAWCSENGCRALPVEEPIIVRYLIARTVEGKFEQHAVSRRSYLIGKIHEMTDHPPFHLGEKAFNAYNRAIGFAVRKLRDENADIRELQSSAPLRAQELFSDGNVPVRWSNVAA